MVKKKYDIKKINENLDNLIPDTATGVIRILYPKIKEKREEGVTLKTIYKALFASGVNIKFTTFKNVVAQLAKEKIEDENV